ncbi:abnormal spindle-like microcephaly-associated protein homolog [Pollicipes pollicipes]|uniref:abnormal spindle-like microcephaly-associated protein homolog n=1 Tax=Pollicipes pollicipes TaxID=41117 RepID=UPI001884AD14|nr:abnormal spindle-like microcephaly-associated protein homolog [Pollicipes pollicipes]
MYYDKDWLQKQERGFTAWLNFILTPSEYSCDDVKVDAARILLEAKRTRVPPAPSRETLSLREYTAQRRLNRLRMDACRLFEEPQMTRVIRNVEREVETGGLRVRRDRTLHADVDLKCGLRPHVYSVCSDLKCGLQASMCAPSAQV